MIPAEKGTVKTSVAFSKSLLRYYHPQSHILPKIAQRIRTNQRFLLTTHVAADADGLGSEIGLYYLLRALGKDALILNNEKVPDYLAPIMPQRLVRYIGMPGYGGAPLQKKLRGRFVFILDSSEPQRSEKVAEVFQAMQLPWSTIDHHITEKKKEYCTDPNYAATAEIIWDLYCYFRVAVPKAAALPLYTGIVADSGNFRYPKTSLRTHLAGGHLLSYGINSDAVFRTLYESNPLDRLKLVARVLPRVVFMPNGVVVLSVLQRDREGLELGDGGTEGLANQLLAHKNLRAAAVLVETEEGELKASLRSVGDVDVAAFARRFGGGGHKNAAGLKLREPFAAAEQKLLQALKSL